MSFNEDIKAYIDGELSPERAEEVRIALESDPALMEEYTSMKDISQKLQSLIRQPQVKGVEQTRKAVAPVRRFRWAEAAVVGVMLFIAFAILFPVFAQSKESAMRMSTRSDTPQQALNPEIGAEDVKSKRESDITATAGVPDDTIYGASLGVAGEPGRDGKNYDDGLALSGGATANERFLNTQGGFEAPKQAGAGDKTRMAVTPGQIKTMDPDMEARLVIKDASFTVKVADVNDAMSKATHLASTYKGYIESSSISQGAEKVPTSGLISIRIPQGNFEKAIEEISKYGTVTDRNTSGDDVTGNVADIEARIRTLTSEEESLRTILRSANKIGDVLEIKDRISQVRQQIESYDSQRRVLTRLSTLATISLRFTTDKEDVKKLEPKDKDDAWFEDTKDAALTILTGIGKFIAQIATFAFVLLPVWVPVLLFLLWFRRRAFVPTA